MSSENNVLVSTPTFFEQSAVKTETLPIGPGVPLGIEQVYNPEVGIGGAYGTWGQCYPNADLPAWLSAHLGEPVEPQEILSLADLGFTARHHVPDLSPADHLELELQVGTKFLQAAMQACRWQPGEVDGVIIGLSGPPSDTFTQEIAQRAGIRPDALKVSVHKACDGSVGGLHLALNPDLPYNQRSPLNVAERLRGKKVLVGGIEGLSRFVSAARDLNALQLFGSAAGVIGVIPGKTMQLLAGATKEVFDDEGVLQVKMYYPHARAARPDGSMVDVSQPSEQHLRFAGLMHEPDSAVPVVMAGPMGMVKLFVRTGVEVVKELVDNYRARLKQLGETDDKLLLAIVHHANLKINKLKEKHLQREGIVLPMPWVLSEFGNVSAASNMIAFLRELPVFKPGHRILIDGFGAGTYYDALIVSFPS